MGPPPWSQGDSYRPRYQDRGPPEPPQHAAAAMYHFQGYTNDRDRRPRGRARDSRGDPKNNFTFRTASKISERPLLRRRDNQNEERVLGSHGQQDKFRDLDNLTDSSEAEMEDSEDETEPNAKRIRLDDTLNSTVQTTKWSNPDPYTSLPAPNETTGKKIDVVKMIRKARQDVSKQNDGKDAAVEEFISLGTNDMADMSFQRSAIPTGPAADRADRDVMSLLQTTTLAEPTNGHVTRPTMMVNSSQSNQNADQMLGKRKRRDDDRDGQSVGKLKQIRGRGSFYTNATILDKWQQVDGVSSTPWLQPTKSDSPGLALHKEILDFYEWVKPQDYEFAVRGDCIDRLTRALRRFQPGELKAFGSYGAGLFLPTGDMDLVFLDSSFLARLRRGDRGVNTPLSRHKFRHWLNFIRSDNIAKPGSIVPIPNAKVPLIKFVDRVSGLKIDLSFNNDTGLVANETFQKWRISYPAMPILVSVIKQYLMMRGLNDVSTGGLGGFSTICLVTSIIQHLPTNGGAQNLGEVLVQFFNVYGNHFDRDAVAIRLDPPSYVDKASYGPQLFNNDKKGRLTIIDPHRPDNNISGGTSEIKLIASKFSEAYDILQDGLLDYGNHDGNLSFLEPLIGGYFEAYTMQRNTMYSLHIGRPGSIAPSTGVAVDSMTTKTLESLPVASAGLAPGTVPDSSDDDSNDANDSDNSHISLSRQATDSPKKTAAEKRAARFKRLRPDLAHQIGRSLQTVEAMKIGSYKTRKAMVEDLSAREKTSQATGLKPSAKRALRLKASRPEIAHQIGDAISISDAMKVGGYRTKEDLSRDLLSAVAGPSGK